MHTIIPAEYTAAATHWWNLHRWTQSVPGTLDGIKEDEKHVEWLKTAKIPVYLFPEVIEQAKADGFEFPTAEPFPREHLLEHFKNQLQGTGYRYFTNSVSWIIAYAIACIQESGAGELALYGIDMAQAGEFGVQRPSCEFWLGVAAGLGIKVTVAARADLLKCAVLYGSEESSDFVIKLNARIAELEQKGQDIANHWEQLRSQMEITRYHQHEIAGALEDCKYWKNNWVQQAGDVRKGGADPYSTGPLVAQSDGAGTPQPVGAVSE